MLKFCIPKNIRTFEHHYLFTDARENPKLDDEIFEFGRCLSDDDATYNRVDVNDTARGGTVKGGQKEEGKQRGS